MTPSRRRVLAGLGALPLLGCRMGSEHRPPSVPRTARVSVPAIDHATLASGPELRLLQDHAVPLVAMAVVVRAGHRGEPAGQEGLVRLVASLLLEGAGGSDRAALLDRYGDLGATPQWLVGPSLLGLSCTVHADDAPAALSLLVDNLRRPTLAEEPFQRLRREQRELVTASRDDPSRVAGLSVLLGVTGLEPPAAALAEGTPRSIAALRLEAARTWLAAHVRPDALVVLLAGAAEPDTALGWVDAATHGWSRPAGSPASTPASVATAVEAPRRTVVVPWPSLGQAIVALGSPRAPYGHADEPAEQVASSMLGSMLHHELRTRQRTTYAVEPATWDTKRGVVQRVEAKVEPTAVKWALYGIIEQVERLVLDGAVAERALDGTRSSIAMALMDDHNGPDAALRQLARVVAEGLGPDAAERRLERLMSLDVSDVRAAAKRLYDPSLMRIGVVGEAAALAAVYEALPGEGVLERRPEQLVGLEPEAEPVELL
jgi:zinc protease